MIEDWNVMSIGIWLAGKESNVIKIEEKRNSLWPSASIYKSIPHDLLSHLSTLKEKD